MPVLYLEVSELFPPLVVTEVQWDSGGSGVRGGSGTLGWDGMKCSDTVEQLTKHSLGYQGGCGPGMPKVGGDNGVMCD